MEVYTPNVTGKSLTLTAIVFQGDDVNKRIKELQIALDRYMKRPEGDATAPTVDDPGNFLSGESVYTNVTKSKQTDKFNVLWNGKIPEGKYASEADMALAEILTF